MIINIFMAASGSAETVLPDSAETVLPDTAIYFTDFLTFLGNSNDIIYIG